MKIRKANIEDLEQILEIYAQARAFMRAHGNMEQWRGGHPYREVLESDIEKGQLYVLEEEELCGVFAFIPGVDPTYGYIEGAWTSDEPYAAIHRVASNGKVKGVFEQIISYCAQFCPHLRIDTHKDNYPMQGAILKQGFTYRGIIYLENGDPRMAYDRYK